MRLYRALRLRTVDQIHPPMISTAKAPPPAAKYGQFFAKNFLTLSPSWLLLILGGAISAKLIGGSGRRVWLLVVSTPFRRL